MEEQFLRTAFMFGDDGVKKLRDSHVAVFGLGGVGGHATEALIRCGIGKLTLIDGDCVSLSDINRQLIATRKTVGMPKPDAFVGRGADISPECIIIPICEFFSKDNCNKFDFSSFDYILDCIDSVPDKLEIIRLAHQYGIPIISAMGAGNKVFPEMFEISDISKTSVCPLAKSVRVNLRKMGINHLKVVYSKETPFKVSQKDDPIGSNSFTPGVMGMLMASAAIRDILEIKQ